MRTRTALLNAAESLLSQHSADAVRMEDVAEVAGISPASVYIHFGTKDALVSIELTAAYSREGSPFEQVRQAGLAYMGDS